MLRSAFALLFLLPSFASAQPTAEQKKETIKWVLAQADPNGGFYIAPQDPNIDAAPRPSLRAVNGAVRSLKYLGAEIPRQKTHVEFVLKCYDPQTGAFAEPGGKPDVAITSIGVMAAMELGIPKEKFAKAMDYLKANAKTFEEVRIGAAAVEAWGVKDCPFKLDDWMAIGADYSRTTFKGPVPTAAQAREFGSFMAFNLRLNPGGKFEPGNLQVVSAPLLAGQRDDGGWGRADAKVSDIESTYRVMRALMLLSVKPKDAKKLRAFLDSHRNKDGGYATKPGDKSTMSGVYYATIVGKWLDEMK
jgi:prenyltransferase beta subunit